MKGKKVLAIVENSVFLEAIEKWKEEHGLDTLIQAPSSVEGIAFYESYKPDAVILEENISDMPISFMVPAMCQLSAGTPIWIMNSSGVIQDEHDFPEGAHGTLSPDLSTLTIERLFQKLPVLHHAQINDQNDTVGIWNDDSLTDTIFPGQVLAAEEINQRKKALLEGDLRIMGDIKDVEELKVNGNLTIQGDCINSHVQCQGNLTVEGVISGKTMGVFCSGNIQAQSILDALVVCGNHLFFRGQCAHSIVNVMGRMIGTGANSRILGGRIRIGQHLAVTEIGNDDQLKTLIEMSPVIFHEGLQKRYFGEAPQNQRYKAIQVDDEIVFHPRTLEELADISVETLFSGVTLRFGYIEDFPIKDHVGGYRIFLSGGVALDGVTSGKITFKKKKKYSLKL